MLQIAPAKAGAHNRCRDQYGTTGVHEGERFVQRRIGLHHVCFRARSREDVDQAHAFIRTLGVPIIRAPQEDGWAPGYYSILFEDPDGVRLEIIFVPGRGVFDTEDGKVKPVEPRAPAPNSSPRAAQLGPGFSGKR